MPDARRQTDAPPRSIVGAAVSLTAPNAHLARHALSSPSAWQEDAWRFYDEIGEMQFAADWHGRTLSRINLVAAQPPRRPGDEPLLIDPSYVDPDTGRTPHTAAQLRAAELVADIAGGVDQHGVTLHTCGVNLAVAGEFWLIIDLDPDTGEERWRVESTSTIRQAMGRPGSVEVQTGGKSWEPVDPEANVIRVWRPHPRRSWEATAAPRGALRPLRTLSLLGGAVDASAESRLAGAGILLLPTEMTFPSGQSPARISDGIVPDDEAFVNTLTDVMTMPVADRSSAAAVVPLVLQVGAAHLDKVKHVSFATPFDERVAGLIDQAIRRLAIAFDMPPEALLGLSTANHWSAWKISDEAISLHVEPSAELVCAAFTEGWLHARLLDEGFLFTEVADTAVWYDTTTLRVRPDRSGSATEAFDRGELSAEAYRRELGFSDDDAPDDEERRLRALLGVARGAPTLAPPMLAVLGFLSDADLDMIARITGDVAEAQAAGNDTEPGSAPNPDSPPAEPDVLAVAADEVMWRALERAGARLRTLARSRSLSVPEVDNATLHEHLDLSAVGADVGDLLSQAWTRVPNVASRCGVDSDDLTVTLDQYARGLLARREAHTHERLAAALRVGVRPPVRS